MDNPENQHPATAESNPVFNGFSSLVDGLSEKLINFLRNINDDAEQGFISADDYSEVLRQLGAIESTISDFEAKQEQLIFGFDIIKKYISSKKASVDRVRKLLSGLEVREKEDKNDGEAEDVADDIEDNGSDDRRPAAESKSANTSRQEKKNNPEKQKNDFILLERKLIIDVRVAEENIKNVDLVQVNELEARLDDLEDAFNYLANNQANRFINTHNNRISRLRSRLEQLRESVNKDNTNSSENSDLKEVKTEVDKLRDLINSIINKLSSNQEYYPNKKELDDIKEQKDVAEVVIGALDNGSATDRKLALELRRRVKTEIDRLSIALKQRTKEIESKELAKIEKEFENWKRDLEYGFVLPNLNALKTELGRPLPIKPYGTDTPESRINRLKGGGTHVGLINQVRTELNNSCADGKLGELQREYVEREYFDKASNLLKKLSKLSNQLLREEESKQEINALVTDIKNKLLDVSRRTEYLVDAHHNEINQTRNEVLVIYKQCEQAGVDTQILKELKERIAEVFYKLYRSKLLERLEYNERINKAWTNIKWTEVFENKIIAEMRNLVEDQVGFNLDNLDDLISGGRSIEQAVNILSHGQNLSNEESAFCVEIIKDFINVKKEYGARRFTRISWTILQPSILPETGIRKYPEGVTADNHPVLLVVDYLLKEGLKESRFGRGTNKILQPNRGFNKLSFENYGQEDFAQYDATAFGDAWRALDRWAKGMLKFTKDDGTFATTSNAHTSEGSIVTALTRYLNKKNDLHGNNKIPENDILRAYRTWAMVTYHQSSRAVTSAHGPDNIYYASKFHEYNAKYAAATTASWHPLVAKETFATINPSTGKKHKPLLYIWGDDPSVRDKRSALTKLSPFPQGYKAMESALKDGGFLTYSDKRKKELGFATFNFLMSPLLTMIDMDQSESWVEEERNGTFHRVRVSDLPSSHNDADDAVDDTSETFALQPVLATVFVRDDEGKTIRYPSKFDADGNEIKGKPVSLMDLQDEWGEIIYEAIPWEQHAEAMYSVVSSLGTNGHRFLTKFLKSKNFLQELEDPQTVAAFKNEGKYVMMHLPSYGMLFAAGMYSQEKELKDLPKALMNMLIAKLVFIGVLIHADTSKEDHWDIDQIETYLESLVSVSGAINSETAEAILAAIKGARQFNIRLSGFAHKLGKNIKDRLTRS